MASAQERALPVVPPTLQQTSRLVHDSWFPSGVPRERERTVRTLEA